MAAASLYLTVLRQGETITMDLTDVHPLVPRCQVQVDERVLTDIGTELTRIVTAATKQSALSLTLEECQKDLQQLGALLFAHLFPAAIQERLSAAAATHLFLRLDDQLVHLPWELAFNGDEFLLAKFHIGRQVITDYRPLSASPALPKDAHGLRMLIIVDPTESLAAAAQEVDQLCELLDVCAQLEVSVIGGKRLRKIDLLRALNEHDLVHYAGHATFDAAHPTRSGWVLDNAVVTALELSRVAHPPLLVFANACQAGATAPWQAETAYEGQAFGIGSAFLLAGAHNYIGTFCVIHDAHSAAFAADFYRHLIQGVPVGEALSAARRTACQGTGTRGLLWASYMHYGNPTFQLPLGTPDEHRAPVADGQQVGHGVVASAPSEAIDLHVPSKEMRVALEQEQVLTPGEPGQDATQNALPAIADAEAPWLISHEMPSHVGFSGSMPGGMQGAMRVARSRPLIMAWVFGLGLSLCLVLLRQWGWLEAWELGVYDRCLRLQTHLVSPDPRLLLIGITEQDIRQQAQWPLSDATVAQLLHKVLAARPRAIGLDLYRDLPVPPGHDALQTLLTAHPEIMVIMKAPTPDSSGVAPPPSVPPERIGFSDLVVDPDGVVRRGLLFLHSDQGPLTALGVRLAWRYLQGEGIAPQPDPRQPAYLRLGPTTLPPVEPDAGSYVQADTRGYQMLLDYQGLKPHPAFVSLTAVLSGAIDPHVFHGKVVLIGVMAESVPDLFQTPLSRGRTSLLMSHGVELHAQLASQLIRASQEGQAPLATLPEWQEVSWILLWGVLGSLSSLWTRSLGRVVLLHVSALAVLSSLTLGLFLLRWWGPLLPPVLVWGFGSLAMTAYEARHERHQGLPSC
jgi:CHASE2 domain-containing sensor protein/CHAT domain-containing protein